MAYSYAGLLSRRGTIQVVIYKNPKDLEGKKIKYLEIILWHWAMMHLIVIYSK